MGCRDSSVAMDSKFRANRSNFIGKTGGRVYGARTSLQDAERYCAPHSKRSKFLVRAEKRLRAAMAALGHLPSLGLVGAIKNRNTTLSHWLILKCWVGWHMQRSSCHV